MKDQFAASDLTVNPKKFGVKYIGCENTKPTDWDERVCNEVTAADQEYNLTVKDQSISNKVFSECQSVRDMASLEDMVMCIIEKRMQEFGIINGAATALKSSLNQIEGF